MSDTFESVEKTEPGTQVVIRAPNDVNVIGVVASMDAETRTVTFTDGKAYTFFPFVEPQPETGADVLAKVLPPLDAPGYAPPEVTP